MSNDVLFVSCTRGRKQDTALYRSLAALGPRWDTLFFENNCEGLSARYNWVLDRPDLQDKLIVFAHDDLQISDPSLAAKLDAPIASGAGIVGLVGSALFLVDPLVTLKWSNAGDPHLSGALWMLHNSRRYFGSLGPSPRRCVVIDGLLIACQPRALNGVRFDERFSFHFYDLDFCLTAITARINISTCETAGVTHLSPGDYTSAAFQEAQRAFLDKWSGRSFSVTAEP